MIEPQAKLKLPVLATLLLAYQIQFSNFGVFLRLAWFPFVVCCVTGTLAAVTAPTIVEGAADQLVHSYQWLFYLGWLSTIPAVTAWHRFVILGAEDPSARIRYEVGISEARYAVVGIVLFWMMFLVALVLALFFPVALTLKGGTDGDVHAAAKLWVYSGTVVGLLSIARFLPVLPARAIGERLRFRDCFRATRGNGVRITVLYLLAIAPEYLVSEVVTSISYGGNVETFQAFGLGQKATFIVLSNIVSFFFFTITISILSIAYKFIVMPQLPERIE